jgi:hypothetical protein
MCSVCVDFASRLAAGNVNDSYGAIAQLVERFHGMEEAGGSIPPSSTPQVPSFEPLGRFFGGLVVGEGSFTSSRALPEFRDGRPRRRFVFSVEMAADHPMLELLWCYFGAGSLQALPPRRSGYLATTRFAIASNRRHLTTTIPIAEVHVLHSAKRRQFDAWRDELSAYLEAHPTRYGRGPSTCRMDGCDRPVRGRGLCRSHYYAETGH